MKKFIAAAAILGAVTAAACADVFVKKIDNKKSEVTFFYGNPRANEVLLAGNITNWQEGAQPMTKTDKGYEITITCNSKEKIIYKFISDGNWTTDMNAPSFCDDGFGGKNSVVVPAKVKPAKK